MSYTKKEFLAEARPFAESILEYAKTAGKEYGITDAEVSIVISEQAKIQVDGGKVVELISGKKCSVSVTLFAGDKKLSFSKNIMDEALVKDAMLKNMQVIDLIPGNPFTTLLEKDKVYKGNVKDFDVYDSAPPSQEELVEYAKKLETAAMSHDGIKGSRGVNAAKGNTHYLTLATNGLDLQKSYTTCSASTSVIATDKDGKMQTSYDYATSAYYSDMPEPEEIGHKAAEDTLSKLNAITPVTSKMDVILSQEAASSFFSAVMTSINGAHVFRGTTIMKDKLGKQVMSKGITIVDDPTIQKSLHSETVDSTGQEMKPITFIKDGVLQCFNVTLKAARQLGIEPIGRDDGLTNLCIHPGSQTPEELMADLKDGIYITELSGGSVTVHDGNFSKPANGLLIKDGKVTDIAVDNFVLAGNLKEMFMNVAVANDTPEQPNVRGLNSPTTRVNKMTIAGK